MLLEEKKKKSWHRARSKHAAVRDVTVCVCWIMCRETDDAGQNGRITFVTGVVTGWM